MPMRATCSRAPPAFVSAQCLRQNSCMASWRRGLSCKKSQSLRRVLTAAEGDNDDPIWVKREKERKLKDLQGTKLPFWVYLLASAIVAIAAVGSIFEWTDKNAIFGQVGPDNPLYTPILGFFGITGLPTAGWLFVQSVRIANEQSDRMNEADK